jgi:hypothetical protein
VVHAGRGASPVESAADVALVDRAAAAGGEHQAVDVAVTVGCSLVLAVAPRLELGDDLCAERDGAPRGDCLGVDQLAPPVELPHHPQVRWRRAEVEVAPAQPARFPGPETGAGQQQDDGEEVLVPAGLEDEGELVVGEPVHRGTGHGDAAAVAGDVADQPVLPDGGRQRRAQRLAQPVDCRRGVAGGELAARERVEFVDGELTDLAVAELGDQVPLDDHPVVRQGGPCQGAAAGLALGRLDCEPPPQVVGEAVVGDRVGQLSMFEILRGDPHFGLRPGVEGPAAPHSAAVGVDAEAHLREQPAVADPNGAGSAPRSDTTGSHRRTPPRYRECPTVGTVLVAIGNR